jgi:hypothetical protein
VDCEEEEEAKDMISLWKKQGKIEEGGVVILTRRGTVRHLCPHPLLRLCHYSVSGSVSGAKPSKNTSHLSITREGEGLGAMVSGPLVSDNSQTKTPFQFPFIVLDGRVTIFYFQTSSPSISTLIAFKFPNPIAFLFPPLLLDGHGVLDATAAR